MDALPQASSFLHNLKPNAAELDSPTAPRPERSVPVHLQIHTNPEAWTELKARIVRTSSQPTVTVDTNKYRDKRLHEKAIFREGLLRELSAQWNEPSVADGFLKLIDVLETQGCAIFAGLIGATRFTSLILDFVHAMQVSGSTAFLHSFLNLSQHPSILRNRNYNDAFLHPLLIAMIAYMMGGPIRMTDARGKDTEPISVNAQDNMLHIDNSPFRHEYKILLGWEKGHPKGPSGQNFTYLPGTHRGNRRIRVDEGGRAWSTENDSIFITDGSLNNVLMFQQQAYGQSPCVVEVQHTEQPVTVAFSAGSLVHHRYRTQDGNARSCIIAAFHLVTDNPGSLLPALAENLREPETIIDFILSQQGDQTDSRFIYLLVKEASSIRAKIKEIFSDTTDAATRLLDATRLTLNEQRLERWKKTVIGAPSTTSVKHGQKCFLATNQTHLQMDALAERLTKVIMYDKHGLLDLKLYNDGREEIRKVARKQVLCLGRDSVFTRIQQWLPAIVNYRFTTSDIQDPYDIQVRTGEIALHLDQHAQLSFKYTERRELGDNLCSFSQLLSDLGESITRCETVETYTTTCLFIFLTIDQVLECLDWASYLEACSVATSVLRSYISTTLVLDATV
ncbi:unnamed protein product [Aspergillus oryzae]|uniref:Unnamed protein product n=1 Tax=Aspergillus oryzae TaxID=5062 RepID=A0A1S9DPR3_ASPOZ|nr:hypothetical protein OAory_01073560 [Aspergillus oryzae]GMF78284.1 unnamed protein product [Aspergillus oryzae]GMF91013.1 unnamed protein product [Aspergillus oryzae]GMG27607.1 unnamed protein product [Aspergillus oryzae]